MILANPKIVLLGYMGCGKSTIGKFLAKETELPFIDLDEYISQREGKEITDIFTEKGEVYFRKKEKEYLEEVLQGESFVLALGGGTPCYWKNMEQVRLSGAVSVYLLLSGKTLTSRLMKEKEHRPLIAHIENQELGEFIHKHLFERHSFYGEASFYVNVEGKSPKDIARNIIERLS